MGRKSKAQLAEEAGEIFHREICCQTCEIIEPETLGEKDSFTFRGQTTYYCPRCNSFAHYLKYGNHYWRRNGEQEQN